MEKSSFLLEETAVVIMVQIFIHLICFYIIVLVSNHIKSLIDIIRVTHLQCKHMGGDASYHIGYCTNIDSQTPLMSKYVDNIMAKMDHLLSHVCSIFERECVCMVRWDVFLSMH